MRRTMQKLNLLLIPLIVIAQHCDKDFKEDCEEKPKCIHFDLAQFNENSPSIMYGEARGRFGNQFLAYMVFLQLKRQLGIESYIDEECK